MLPVQHHEEEFDRLEAEEACGHLELVDKVLLVLGDKVLLEVGALLDLVDKALLEVGDMELLELEALVHLELEDLAFVVGFVDLYFLKLYWDEAFRKNLYKLALMEAHL